MEARLIVDLPASGAWNMAVDQSLVNSALRQTTACLRFYRWSAATLSLGYFQRHRDRHGHGPSAHCPLVRRPTGGGAILHDRELTYSFTAAIENRTASDLRGLYQTFHQALVDQLHAFGVRATLSPQAVSLPASDEPFLCFQRRAAGDVLLDDCKIAGSAQRRYKHAILQHGSVLLSTSPFAPEIRGIEQLAQVALEAEALAQRWSRSLGERLGLHFRCGQLSELERQSAHDLVRQRFDHRSWTQRR